MCSIFSLIGKSQLGITRILRQTICYHPKISLEKESHFLLSRPSLYLPFFWVSAWSWTWPTASGLQGAGRDQEEEEDSPDSEDRIPTWSRVFTFMNPFMLLSLTPKCQIKIKFKFDFQYHKESIIESVAKVKWKFQFWLTAIVLSALGRPRSLKINIKHETCATFR